MGKILRFWLRVLLRFGKTVGRFFDIRGHLLEGFIRYIALLGLSYFASLGIVKLDIVQQYSSDFQEFIRYTFLLVTALFGLLIFNFIYQPSKMYEELGGFLKIPLAITPEPQKPRVNSETWASVKVQNISGFRVEKCTLTLLSAIDIATGQEKLRTSERLTWSGRDQRQPNEPGDEPKTIIGKDWKICDVAQTQGDLNRVIFTLWFNNNQTVPIGKYNLTIYINGEWMGQEKVIGFSDERHYLLTYNGGYDLSIDSLEQ